MRVIYSVIPQTEITLETEERLRYFSTFLNKFYTVFCQVYNYTIIIQSLGICIVTLTTQHRFLFVLGSPDNDKSLKIIIN
jgi:hypothetical protein